MIPLLVIIPFWREDSCRVTKLAKVMAYLEAQKTDDCWVMPVPRQDCEHNREAIGILATKFRVIEFKANSPLRGYPAGSNGIFSSAMIHTNLMFADKVEAAFWMEPDATPMRPDWRTALINAWRGRRQGVHVMGHALSPNGTPEEMHVNGGALYAPDIMRIFPDITVCDGAWDWSNRHQIMKMGQHTEEIRYIHRMQNLQWENFGPRQPAVVHGMKDDSLILSIAERYGFQI